MNIKIKADGVPVEYETFVFSGGELQTKLVDPFNEAHQVKEVSIFARLTNSEEVIRLALLKDAIERLWAGDYKINLTMPYTPYARQDRVCYKGEAFSLRILASLVNFLNFNSVTVYDPHSDVTGGLFNNVKIVTQVDILSSWEKFWSKFYLPTQNILVSPDAGSNKKVSEFAKWIGHREFARADKLRNLQTGQIIETVVYKEDFEGKNVIILDDICDGGRTFVELAKILRTRNCGKIALYVTHGIFSNGVDYLFHYIDEVWTTNSFREEYDEQVNVLDIEK